MSKLLLQRYTTTFFFFFIYLFLLVLFVFAPALYNICKLWYSKFVLQQFCYKSPVFVTTLQILILGSFKP